MSSRPIETASTAVPRTARGQGPPSRSGSLSASELERMEQAAHAFANDLENEDDDLEYEQEQWARAHMSGSVGGSGVAGTRTESMPGSSKRRGRDEDEDEDGEDGVEFAVRFAEKEISATDSQLSREELDRLEQAAHAFADDLEDEHDEAEYLRERWAREHAVEGGAHAAENMPNSDRSGGADADADADDERALEELMAEEGGSIGSRSALEGGSGGGRGGIGGIGRSLSDGGMSLPDEFYEVMIPGIGPVIVSRATSGGSNSESEFGAGAGGAGGINGLDEEEREALFEVLRDQRAGAAVEDGGSVDTD